MKTVTSLLVALVVASGLDMASVQAKPRKPAPAQETLTYDELECQRHGRNAASIAQDRNRGVLLTTVFSMIRTVLAPSEHAFYEGIALSLFTNRVTPAFAAQATEMVCLQALSPLTPASAQPWR